MVPKLTSIDADLFVFVGLQTEEIWGPGKLDLKDAPRGFMARDEEVIREPQIVPRNMSDWRYEHISIDPQVVAQRAKPINIPASALELIPDALGWKPLQIVSSRFKDFLEKEFPEGSMFYPFSYSDADSGEVNNPDIWFWLPRHYLAFLPKEKRSRDQMLRPQAWGTLGRHDVTWEMHHNKGFQDFVAELPFWISSPTFNQTIFRSDVYHKLKAHGFQGFVEANANNYLCHTPEQSVGYVSYVK